MASLQGDIPVRGPTAARKSAHDPPPGPAHAGQSWHCGGSDDVIARSPGATRTVGTLEIMAHLNIRRSGSPLDRDGPAPWGSGFDKRLMFTKRK